MRVVLFLMLAALPLSRAAENLPTSSNLVARLIERSRLVASVERTNPYTYDKRSVTAELDEKDRVIKSTEKLYKVMLIGGVPFPRLVKVQGKGLTPQQLEREN